MITFYSVLTTEAHMKHIHAVVVQIYTYIYDSVNLLEKQNHVYS